ncbi:MAG: hypothetical protein E3K32_10035 [wastewater metagenome]|nr:hypothetical protein [Candidatus Loosdrechtia aerotolerans]
MSGKAPQVTLSPGLDKKIYELSPLPVTVGLYIAPELRSFVQEASVKRYQPGAPHFVYPNFVFPVGEALSPRIKKMSEIIFQEVIVLDNLQDNEYVRGGGIDGILSIDLKNSDIELYIDKATWRAVGTHNLSIIASFLDPRLNRIWKSEISVEEKGLDVATTKVEFEWWVTTGPDFSPAVEYAIEKLVYELAREITTSEEIVGYSEK